MALQGAIPFFRHLIPGIIPQGYSHQADFITHLHAF
jgi:hypothetical protein